MCLRDRTHPHTHTPARTHTPKHTQARTDARAHMHTQAPVSLIFNTGQIGRLRVQGPNNPRCGRPINNVPGHTTSAPPVGFEPATNGIRFYVQHFFRPHAHALLAGEIALGEMNTSPALTAAAVTIFLTI